MMKSLFLLETYSYISVSQLSNYCTNNIQIFLTGIFHSMFINSNLIAFKPLTKFCIFILLYVLVFQDITTICILLVHGAPSKIQKVIINILVHVFILSTNFHRDQIKIVFVYIFKTHCLLFHMCVTLQLNVRFSLLNHKFSPCDNGIRITEFNQHKSVLLSLPYFPPHVCWKLFISRTAGANTCRGYALTRNILLKLINPDFNWRPCRRELNNWQAGF